MMKKFTFRFESLLKTKEIEVNQAMHEVSIAEKASYEIRAMMREILCELASLEDRVHEIQRAPSSLEELYDYQSYFTVVERRKIKTEDELLLAENELARRKQRLKTCLKEKKIIENLKEKQYKAWKDGIKKWEDKLIDETAVLQFIRKARDE